MFAAAALLPSGAVATHGSRRPATTRLIRMLLVSSAVPTPAHHYRTSGQLGTAERPVPCAASFTWHRFHAHLGAATMWYYGTFARQVRASSCCTKIASTYSPQLWAVAFSARRTSSCLHSRPAVRIDDDITHRTLAPAPGILCKGLFRLSNRSGWAGRPALLICCQRRQVAAAASAHAVLLCRRTVDPSPRGP